MIRINNNDMILFKYLFEENYIHIDDLLNLGLLSHKYKSNIRRRLSNLKKEGYIKYKADPKSYKNYVFPTEKAKLLYDMKYKEFKNEVKMRSNSYMFFYKPEKYTLRKQLDLNSLIHDRKLTQLRLCLEDIGVDYWQRETMYYNHYKKNPDAIFKINDLNFAVEVERTFKDRSRYEEIFTKYEKLEKISFTSIIYITLDDEVFNQMSKLINNINVPKIEINDWQEKYRVAEFNDFFKDKRFLFYKPYTDEWIESTDKMKKYVKRKG